MRTAVAERVSGALAFLHRHGIVASDIAPNNLLVGFAGGRPEVCFIDCDSMVFHGRQALPQVETADWQIPLRFSEPPRTRAADAYKLGLMMLRLYARAHDARALAPHVRHVPAELRELLARSLSPAAANRPPAGEWQRGLRQALSDGGLNERYPGPRPATASRSAASSSADPAICL
jgi:serine/threonine protein kinase